MKNKGVFNNIYEYLSWRFSMLMNSKNFHEYFLTFQAFMTLVSNALRVAAINSVGDFVLFLGKIGVTAATAAVGIFWFKVSLILNHLHQFH